jgi:hypothetical protein
MPNAATEPVLVAGLVSVKVADTADCVNAVTGETVTFTG